MTFVILERGPVLTTHVIEVRAGSDSQALSQEQSEMVKKLKSLSRRKP